MAFQFINPTSGWNSLYGAAIARFAHGLLVISSPDSVDAHSDWDPSVEPIHAGPDSIYVSVQQAVSGPVAVTCVVGPHVPERLDLLYSGTIELSRPTLSVYDPNGAVNLQLPVEERINRIEIYGDDPDESEQLVVVLTGRTE